MIYKDFLLVHGLPFYSLISVLKKTCFDFYQVHFIDLSFYGSYFWESFCLIVPRSKRFPMVIFSPLYFIVLDFTFKFAMHLELMFVNGAVRYS